MAIAYARVEFVKRSDGKNACAKSAYNSRSEIRFEGNKCSKSKTYDWSFKGDPAHHSILLPDHVDKSLSHPRTLWNLVESKERKVNAQVALDLVLALPDDKQVTLEDRIKLAEAFVKSHFIEKGLGAQIDIHAPEKEVVITQNNRELGLSRGTKGQIESKAGDRVVIQLDSGAITSFDPREFTGFVEKEHNWHAHVLITTRRFTANGLDLDDHKARDLMPRLAHGKVISGPDWGKLWGEHQNRYFEEKGLDLRVDPRGMVAQEHLGPYRMRARAFSLFEEHQRRIESNQLASLDPAKILEAITEKRSVFTKEDAELFFSKHVPTDSTEEVTQAFWKNPGVIPLVDKKTGEIVGKFTSQKVIEEEQRILRLCDRIQEEKALTVDSGLDASISKDLNPEQLKAYRAIITERRLSLIQGYAGTGKSYLLKAVQEAHEKSGYRVRAFGPDNATVSVLQEKGLSHTENIYRFLTAKFHDHRKILKGREVWILDEAAKVGNQPFLELLKQAEKHQIKLILSGDAAQLAPIERGGMFKVLCDRYGSQVLEDIQRQSTDQQREVARDLATGKFGAAIDALCRDNKIRWSGDKREAIEALITRWAQDTRNFPSASTLLIAHSNAEVRVLNEMVRLIRRQRGELEEKEFSCATTQGNIYVSVGDNLKFRKNDRDLGITNGIYGTLVEADTTRFVVSLHLEKGERQTVAFNPQEYNAFQLGYASTYHKAQGKTVERAYVLHSPMMNKEMFYVGLTRHVRDVQYFVSKKEVYCLSDLKRIAGRSDHKELTVEYTTPEDIQSQKEIVSKNLFINNLKESESLITRMKGHGLATWDKITQKATEIHERVTDRAPDPNFYRLPVSSDLSSLAKVEEVAKNADLERWDPKELVQPLLIEEKQRANFASSKSPRSEESLRLSSILKSPTAFRKLDVARQPVVQAYLDALQRSGELKELVDIESQSHSLEMRHSPHFKEWQEACGKRNEAAYKLIQNVESDKVQQLFSQKVVSFIHEEAHRYEQFLERTQMNRHKDIEEELKEQVEPLLYKLFPDGPTSRDRVHYRFGSKGALAVVHSGQKVGQFFDHEQQDGGGLLKLIQRELGLGRKEAKEWAQEFVGIAPDLTRPQPFQRAFKDSKPTDTWISLKPGSDQPAPKFEELRKGRLAEFYTEESRHAYRDQNGDLLYYVLRLRDKNDPTRKITPPLSYGYWQDIPGKIEWDLKGYQTQKSVLYNLYQLKDNFAAPVLVVEGEKTADRALNNLSGQGYVCVTWSGGAGAVQRADWTPLTGRKVIIWPDNDEAGRKAAESLCTELKRVGVESLHLVNPEELKKNFPNKWDLADELPQGMSVDQPQKLIASSLEKGISASRLLHRTSLNINDTSDKSMAQEILWRVDERMRHQLEGRYGVYSTKVQEEILKEATSIIQNIPKVKEELRQKHQINGTSLDRVCYQTLMIEAKTGTQAKFEQVETLKYVVRELGGVTVSQADKDGVFGQTFDRALSQVCDRALDGNKFNNRAGFKEEVVQLYVSLQQSGRQQMLMQKSQEKTNEIDLKL